MKKETPRPRVTVMIPAYNAGSYLNVAIDSVLHQTEQNLEVIIVDDCSTDDTFQIAQRYMSLDSRVHAVRFLENHGQFHAMNYMAECAKGQWLALLDSDDWYAPNRLKALIDAAEEKNVSMVTDNQYFYDNGAQAISKTMFPVHGRHQIITMETFLKRSNPALYNRSDYGLFKPVIETAFLKEWKIKYYEDGNIAVADYYHHLACLMTGNPLLYIDTPMYFYMEPIGLLSRQWAQTTRTPYAFDLFSKLNDQFINDHRDKLTPDATKKLIVRGRAFQHLARLEHIKHNLRNRDVLTAVKLWLEAPIKTLGLIFLRLFQQLKWKVERKVHAPYSHLK